MGVLEMTTTLRTAAQQALEALEGGGDSWRLIGPAIDALRAALAESANSTKPVVESEPVAWMWEHQLEDLKHYGFLPNMRAWTTERRTGNFERLMPVYTHPPRREWRGLTEEEIKFVLRQVAESIDASNIVMTHWPIVSRAIEQALKEKNHE
jgi:hypothetical protein